MMNPSKEEWIEDLLRQMTLEEKVGQMVQSDPGWKQDIKQLIREGRIGTMLSFRDPRKINILQHIAVEESRLHIPLIFANDVIHGYRTIFPIPLALSCTWDPGLIEAVARTISCEAAAMGTTWNFAPMVDISRDPRWGRIAEGAGEDPYLGERMAEAWVRGFQSTDLPGGRGMAACVKHYAAYGGAEAGKDYNMVDMSERRLRETYLPPYHSAIEAGVQTAMTSFNELNGIPATANRFLMDDILRREWNFDGVLISDYDAIGELIPHGLSEDHKEASYQAACAGVDIDMMGNAYHFHLADLVREGKIPESVIDRAARRILRLKFDLGLFANPYIDEKVGAEVLLSPAYKEQARKAAEGSMVLLKNQDSLLPLDVDGKTVALIGPLAEDRENLLGSWVCDGRPQDAATLRESLEKALPPAARLICAKGCEIEGNETDFREALEAGRRADLIVLALGEANMMSGEAHSRAYLGLPGSQQALVDSILGLGKPVIAVLFCGRPLVIPGLVEQVPAILMAWQGGTCSGDAVANLLLGKANPSGKLTASFPHAEGQIPVYYAHKSTGRPMDGQGVMQFNHEHKSRFLDVPNTPLFPFGFGLSYTEYAYSDLSVETPVIPTSGTLIVSATVANTGKRDGSEIVQCYVRDLFGSVTRPVKELKAFQKLSLMAGESRRVRFEIPASKLAFWGPEMRQAVEPGDFKVWVGPDSSSGLEGTFKIE